MIKILTVIICLAPFFVKAQADQGIVFTNGLNWQQVKAKAKSEHKDIFVDIYATWCGPCKLMDKEIYTDSEIGDYVNKKYISVKVQIDSSINDSPEIKSWYSEAKRIKDKYKIEALPSFLFLNADEELLDRDLGFKNKNEFFGLVNKVSNAVDSYTSRIFQFKNGNLRYDELIRVALEAKKNGDDSLALHIASEYKMRIEELQPNDSITTPDFAEALSNFPTAFNVNDNIIYYLYKNPRKSESAMQRWHGFSTQFAEYFINRDIINKTLWPNNTAISGKPDWQRLEKEITEKFDRVTAHRLMVNTKALWYTLKNDWPNVIKYEIRKVELNGIDTSLMGSFNINKMVYDILFKHSSKKADLKKGIRYMETILKADPGDYHNLDTYANILYKAGYKSKAIKEQLKAIELAKEDKQNELAKDFQETLNKMYRNQPTWE